jgi:hypothetical protein
VAALVVAVSWLLMTPLRNAVPTLPIALETVLETLPISFILLSFPAIVVVHELVHAAVHPMSGRSAHSILGFWPSRVLFYTHYDGELTRNRFVATCLMPLVVISLVPLVVAIAVQSAPGWVAFVSVFNALLACGDMLGAGMVLFQMPATAILRNQGWRTYWRERETLAALP